MKREDLRLSVVITNFNYASFVATAIESVRAQAGDIEIIVVDDCSTDNSREVIAKYSDVVIPVLQATNQGHGGGFNAGFARASGDLVMFLDADDFMLPGALETILGHYDGETGLYLYRMYYADDDGVLGGVFPPLEVAMAEGDVSAQLRQSGSYSATVTSGMVYDRRVLETVMPMDSEKFRQGADGYLAAVMPLHAPVRGFDDVISAYRQHSSQHSKFAQAYAKRARWRIYHHGVCYEAIRDHAARLGLDVADDLGKGDPGHLQERLVSLLFEPASHPVPTDTRAALLKGLRDANLARSAGAKALARNIWWIAIGLVPEAQARTLLSWKIDVAARPKWMNATGRWLRQRFGIVTN